MRDTADFAKLEHLLRLSGDIAKTLAVSRSNGDVPLLLHVAREIEQVLEKLEQRAGKAAIWAADQKGQTKNERV